jgi:hypothetical protein
MNVVIALLSTRTGVLPHVKMRAWGFWLARVSVRV